MSAEDRRRWDEKYASRSIARPQAPSSVIEQFLERLPPGRALDVACGNGGFAVWLAQRGWSVVGVDLSMVALEQARQLADELQVSVVWMAADLDDFVPEPGGYDLITVFRYLDRDRLPQRLIAGLKPGGWLIYETFVDPPVGVVGESLHQSRYSWKRSELRDTFVTLQIAHYDERLEQGESWARLIAQKPASAGENGVFPSLGIQGGISHRKLR